MRHAHGSWRAEGQGSRIESARYDAAGPNLQVPGLQRVRYCTGGSVAMSAHTASDSNGNSTDWIRDLVSLAFPEGESRERVLIDLVRQFAKMDPEDPEWLRYKLSVVECRAMENIAGRLV